MDFWAWVLLVEYVVLGLAGIYVLAERACHRAALRRLMLHAYRQHPIANLAPPTNVEVGTPAGWTATPPK